MKKMAVIGCGKMAFAIVLGINQADSDLTFVGFNPTTEKAEDLMNRVGGEVFSKIEDIPPCDYYLIGAKPQHFQSLKESFSPPEGSTVISLMAGVSVQSLQKGFNLERIVRLMPNTPVLIGEGVIGLFASAKINADNLAFLTNVLRQVGLVQVVDDEKLMDVITAFTGSGPAYIFEVADILMKYLNEKGFGLGVSEKLIEQMIFGASALMYKSNELPETLRNNVTSKGGTTEAALNIFKDQGLKDILRAGIDANILRAQKLQGEN